jgi:hypothetical protein
MNYRWIEEVPTPVRDLGLAIEPIVARREWEIAWDMQGKIWYLRSAYNNQRWPARKALTAHCGMGITLPIHDAPDLECECGIYAYSRDGFENRAFIYEFATQRNSYIFGEVYLWGRVLICENGFRAEYAYPKNLTIKGYVSKNVGQAAADIECSYGIPVTIC